MLMSASLRHAPPPAPTCAFARIEAAVGKTPLAHIRLKWRGLCVEIFAKAEMYNLSGSIKDRMALNILRCAYASGALKPGHPIAEATSGNAGIAIAAIGGALGHPVVITMPDWMSIERRQLIASYGAEVRLVSREQGGFLGSIAAAERLGAEEGHFLPRQFCNEDNCRAHADSTLPELWAQMERLGARPDAFVAGVGTGGTVMGAARFLRAMDPRIAVHPVEPASSPTLSTGHKVGHHRMQGISDEFIPEIVRLEELSEIIAVDDGDAILMAQRLGRELGLGVGISSGGNVLAAVKAAALLGSGARVATVLADSHMKYLSTDLMRDEPVKRGYLTPDIAFEGLSITQ
jgi:cysteine synthase A